MSSPVSSLPDRWVERIWAAMRATYGAAFDRQWECPAGVDPLQHVADLKAHWGRELARFQQCPQAIAYGLDNLPPHPPNLIEFKAACNRRPEPAMPALPAPKPDPERLGEALKRLAQTQGEKPQGNSLAWADDLREREQHQKPGTGASLREGLTKFQREAWREALHVPRNHPAFAPLEAA